MSDKNLPDANAIPDAIQWHEGMLLSPHHFQQQAARFESLLQYQTAAASPFHWGVQQFACKVEKDELIVTQLVAVMPDGLVVSYDNRKDGYLKLDLKLAPEQEPASTQTYYESEQGEELQPERNQQKFPMMVHLTVNRDRSVSRQGELGRYRAINGELVPDENLSPNERQLTIPRLRPRLVLNPESELHLQYVGFPLVKINFINGSYSFNNGVDTPTEFIEPCLAVTKESPLGKMCQEVVQKVREKAKFLITQSQSPTRSMGLAVLLDHRTMLQNLIAPLFSFEAALDSEVSHPYQLYLSLCSLAGHIAGIGSDLGQGKFPPKYDHNDLHATFRIVRDFINCVLDRAISISYETIPFKYDHESRTFTLKFRPEWKKQRLVIGLRGYSGTSEMDLLKWGEDCLIAPKDKMHDVRKDRVLGVDRKQIDREGDLVQISGTVLFALREDSEYLKPNTELQIFNPGSRTGDLQPSEIVLYVPKKADAEKK